jgi:hypothetical protein
MKIYDNKSNDEIADWLNAHGVEREFKTGHRKIEGKRL